MGRRTDGHDATTRVSFLPFWLQNPIKAKSNPALIMIIVLTTNVFIIILEILHDIITSM